MKEDLGEVSRSSSLEVQGEDDWEHPWLGEARHGLRHDIKIQIKVGVSLPSESIVIKSAG